MRSEIQNIIKLVRKKIKQVWKKYEASVNEAFDGDRASRKSRYTYGFYLALIQIWGEEDPGFYGEYQG